MPATNVQWPVPLQRLNPWYPGQFGVPGTDSDTGLRTNYEGTVFYVDPNATGVSDSRDGTDPTEPLQTVAAALTKCQAYRGDVIAVMANGRWQYGEHQYRQTAIVEEVTVDVPGVRIVGLAPSSSLGVYWEPTQNDGVCITVVALDVTIEGFCFSNPNYTGGTGIFAEWDGTNTYGENMVVRHCYFGEDLDYGIQLDYSWYNWIHDCYFESIGTAAIFNADVNGDPDYLVVERCHFIDNTAAIKLPDAANCHIISNWIQGDPTVAGSYIDLTDAANNDNIVADNWLASTHAQYVGGNCADSGRDYFVNNHCVDQDTTQNP